jgi:phospholipid/cholesterol/gamma-HCH transport system substrate-binding protein
VTVAPAPRRQARPRGSLRRAASIALATLLLATGAGCGLLGGDDTYEVTAYFPRAVSLFPSSQVRVLGLPSGTVTAVEIEGDRVRVDMAIDSDVPLPVDVNAEIIPQSLIGERYVQLFPAFQTGMAEAPDGHVIGLERAIVPVEPDEALEALRDFLDSLDPDGLGNLIDNLEENLRDQGEPLGRALSELSELVTTFAESDDVLVRIVDSFDRLTATLSTREQQLGEVLAAFGEASQILADERRSIESFVDALARVSEDGFDLVSEHAVRLRDDIDTLTAAGRTIVANLDAVGDLLDSGPLLVSGEDGTRGLLGAYNHEMRAINLRNSFSPIILAGLRPLFDGLGLDLPCIPLLQFDTVCAQSTGEPVVADITLPSTPIDDVLAVLAAPTAPAPVVEHDNLVDRVGAAATRAATTLLGVER